MNPAEKIFEELFERYPVLEPIRQDIAKSYEIICECYKRGGKVLICGNGGSAADAEHIVGELMKGFIMRRELNDKQKASFEQIENGEYIASHLQGGLPAIALNAHSGLNSAFANDVAPDMVYAQQVWAYAYSSPDVLIALSTSGNSVNVVNAVRTACALDIDSIGITGNSASALSSICSVCIRLPEEETFKIQELTLPVYHALCAMVEATYFKN